MGRSLHHWLLELQPQLLPRWIDTLSPAHVSSNGSPGNGDYDASFSTGYEHLLPQVYEGVLAGSQGDLATLDRSLHPLSNTERPLPELLAICFCLRRIVRELLLAQGLPTTDLLPLLDDLDSMVERMALALTQEHITQADFLASRLAQATDEADRAALQLSALNAASQQLASSLDIEQILQLAGDQLLHLLDVDFVSIWLNDEQQGLRCAQTWGTSDTPATGMILSGSADDDLVLRALHTSRQTASFSVDVAAQGPWHVPGCGVVVLPLLVKDQSGGVVVLQDTDPEQKLPRSQQDLARAVTNQAAMALENARLYAKIRSFNSELEILVAARTSELQAEKDRLSTLHEIALEVSSTLDLDVLLQNSLAALARITNAQHGAVMLLEQETDHLVTRAVLGIQVDVGFTRFPRGVGIAGWVAQHRRPALVADVQNDDRWVTLPNGQASRRRVGTMIAVPLIAQSEVMGVITLSHPEVGAFNDDHLRLLAASAGEIAIGIHNARTYSALESQMQRGSELMQQRELESGQKDAILQSLTDGVLVCDPVGQVLSVNPAAGRIMKLAIEELLIENMYDLLKRLAGKRVAELPLDDLLAQPLDQHDQARMFQSRFELGNRTISVVLGPVMTEKQELVGALALMRDITPEVEADRMKTEFIGTMSHELRTPMTSIKGFTQLLAMGSLGAVNDTQREFLNTIHVNAERMISIINDVLDITKIETGSVDLELRPLHLADSISSVVSELHTLTQSRNHTLIISIPPGLPLITADARRLHQVLLNLMSNAVKYTPRNGRIEVESFEAPPFDQDSPLGQHLILGKRYVQVNVRDTGVGIAAEEQEQVFERFYRTENPLKIEAGGTGLGLSLVRPLIELMSGRIWLVSELNEGSTFSFVLPVA